MDKLSKLKARDWPEEIGYFVIFTIVNKFFDFYAEINFYCSLKMIALKKKV